MLVALAENSIAQAPGEPWRSYVLALALYRAGRYEAAIRRLEASLALDPNWHARALNWPVLAVAHYRLGRADEAMRWLVRAERANPAAFETWWDRLEFAIILREAQALTRDPQFPKEVFAR